MNASQQKVIVRHIECLLNGMVWDFQLILNRVDSNLSALFFQVRATPDPSGEQLQRIRNEMHLILYLAAARLEHVCPPIAVTAHAAASASASLGEDFNADAYVVHEAGLTLVVFEHAQGEPVNFGDWLWVSNQAFARAWGRWIGLLHQHTVRPAGCGTGCEFCARCSIINYYSIPSPHGDSHTDSLRQRARGSRFADASVGRAARCDSRRRDD